MSEGSQCHGRPFRQGLCMEELRDGDVFGMGRKGYLCWYLSSQSQAVDPVQGVLFMVSKRRATPSTVPLHSACLGPSGAPRTSISCREPPKKLTWRKHSLPIAITNNKRQCCIPQRLAPREGRYTGSCSIPLDRNLPPKIRVKAQLHVSDGMGRERGLEKVLFQMLQVLI